MKKKGKRACAFCGSNKPHVGGARVSVVPCIPYDVIAMALNFVWPSLTAFVIATRSAHVQRGYEAFSTLQPI